MQVNVEVESEAALGGQEVVLVLSPVACDKFKSAIIPLERYHESVYIVTHFDQLQVIWCDPCFLRCTIKESLGLLEKSGLKLWMHYSCCGDPKGGGPGHTCEFHGFV